MTERRLIEGNVWQVTFSKGLTWIIVCPSIQEAINEACEYVRNNPSMELMKLEHLSWVRGVIV